MRKLYISSLVSGITPMITGGVIFTCWAITKKSWLMLAGVINIYAGLGLFANGVICLFLYFHNEKKVNKSIAIKKGLISLAILLANFPMALAALYGASYLLSLSNLLVQNNTEFRINDLVLIERDKIYKFPVIPPEASVSESYYFKYEGSVAYKLTVNTKMHEGVAFGYVTNNSGGSAKMIISSEEQVTVEDQ